MFSCMTENFPRLFSTSSHAWNPFKIKVDIAELLQNPEMFVVFLYLVQFSHKSQKTGTTTISEIRRPSWIFYHRNPNVINLIASAAFKTLYIAQITTEIKRYLPWPGGGAVWWSLMEYIAYKTIKTGTVFSEVCWECISTDQLDSVLWSLISLISIQFWHAIHQNDQDVMFRAIQ